MARIGTVPLLVLVVSAAWAIPIWELLWSGSASAIGIITAAMFTGMLAAYPLLAGRRVAGGRVQRAALCRDCNNVQWPSDRALGFCIHCGSTKAPGTLAF